MEAMREVLTHGVEPRGRFRQAEARAQAALEEYNATVTAPGPRDPRWAMVGT